jgi:hypothetical protein
MSTTTHEARCRPEDVWAVLADGWTYSGWVVGASRIREVDGSWPEPGSRIHHSVGVWPLVIDDSTSVERSEQGRRLVLRARAWPTGEAYVDIRLEPSATGCAITLVEDVAKGPARLLPSAVRQPMLQARNREALRRLALMAEGHAHGERTG